MKDKFRAVLLQLHRMALELRTQSRAIGKDDAAAMQELTLQAICVAGSCKLVSSGGNFEPDESAAIMIEAGWPADEVNALLAVVRAQDALSNTLQKKRDSETLN